METTIVGQPVYAFDVPREPQVLKELRSFHPVHTVTQKLERGKWLGLIV